MYSPVLICGKEAGMPITDSVNKLSGVGEERKKLLNRVGIYTVADLLNYFPRTYEDRSVILPIKDLAEDEKSTFRGYIKNIENTRFGGKVITNAEVYDGTGKVRVVWYNQPYLKNSLSLTDEYMFTGILRKKYGRREVVSPEMERITDKESLSMGRIIPLYHLTDKLSQKFMRGIIKQALDKNDNTLPEFINTEIRKKYKLCERNFAIDNIHFPKDYDSFFIARRRAVFEELYLMQTALLMLKSRHCTDKDGTVLKNTDCSEFLKSLPYRPTNAQIKTIEDIKGDMTGGKVMNRLVQGDVGSGKTAVAMAAAYITVKSGYQCALMAPTEVLARQHYKSFKNTLDKFGINTALLTGGLTAKERKEAYEAIENGAADIIIGTSALIQDKLKFKNLALVITDEQHRFGVNQRSILSEKGIYPHVMVMTATPIPRTLALILYGDLDISIIDELPPGRQKIDTRAVSSAYHKRIYTFIENHVREGRQAYIICPMVEENEENDIKSAVAYAQELKNGGLKNVRVECLHGKMKAKEKQDIMAAFARGEIDVLVSTTVIEVGIDVPNANIIVIENAERFGLAQLHQLRGRVGRGSEQSYCVLITDSKSDVTKKRMEIMVKNSDGFVISENDLDIRGPGEFFGTRQHGLPELKIANLYNDMDILKQAQEAAVYSADKIESDDFAPLRSEIERFFRPERVNI